MKFKIEPFDIEDKRAWVVTSDDEQDAWEYWMDNEMKLEDEPDDFYIIEIK